MTIIGYPWWGVLFFAIGVFAVLAVIVSLFFSLGRRPGRVELVTRPHVGSDEFLVAAAALVNGTILEGGRAEILDNGDAAFADIADAIRRARFSVNFMVYIWEPGQVSRLFTDALVEAAERGVQVRVMLDGMGGLRAPDEDLDRIKRAGAQVEVFRPASFGFLLRFYKRNHRRAIVIDGRIGYTGGMAVGDKWLGDARSPDEWRDFMIRVTGPLAANLQSAFSELWANTRGEILVGDAYFPSGEEADEEKEREREAGEAMRHLSLISSPSGEEHPIRLFFVFSFEAARERLWITTPYFVPDETTRGALCDSARRGADVRVLVPSEHTDAAPIRWASHAYYAELLAAGVRIWEYQPTFIHSKAVVIDGCWSIVGSANLDVRSKELNEENVIGIAHRGFAERMEADFLADLERSREIKVEEWQGRSPVFHFRERVACLFAEQF